MSGKYYAIIGTLDVRPDNQESLLTRFGGFWGRIEPRYSHAGKKYMLVASTRFGEDDAKEICRRLMKTGDYIELLYVCEGGERSRDADD